MDINIKKSPTSSFRSFYLFFIVVTMQVGVGIMGAPRWIFIHARQDSWISILIAWLAIAIVVAIMLLILKQYENADIFGIQVDIFGKWIGTLLGLIFIVYFFISNLVVLATYIEVIHVFLYPDLPSYAIGGAMILLVLYAFVGKGGYVSL
ncbi:GerAB/ArcD/ProY family transporter [Virgibacillus sp. 179-BFC.A HS]|uniref:GerAB/ArcD/ProY family transporter n=1 Tax=Tigheibacillus jepli TaxID=3035914 RepID=A0ABU5CJ29_9BACI|nr:GerAB/ArcD/ProY family transporter [Virgibacillus sp. 179-BFC.A HS]MDY0406329.1 GerAB/ArcD/ProY family transporter [Virgibacillus sp. 179-BFC.A HS]